MNYATANIFGNTNRLKRKDRVILLLRTITVTVGLTCCHQVVYAAEYHVGTSGNDGNSGTSSQPWRTIGKANKTLQAGDTVYIHAGTYNEQIRPASSGTSDSNRVIYRAYGDGTVTITSVGNRSGAENYDAGGIALGGRSYIMVDGLAQTLRVDPGSAPYSALGNLNGASHNIIDGVYFDGSGQTSKGNFLFALNHRFTRVATDSTYNIIRNCHFLGLAGEGTYTEDGVMFGDGAHHNLFENNTAEEVRHIPLNFASDASDGRMPSDNVIRNNTVSNTYHTAMGFYGAGNGNVIENNIVISSGEYNESPAGSGNGIQISADETIIRYNRISHAGARNVSEIKNGGIAFIINGGAGNVGEDTAISNTIYNNTIVDNEAPSITVVNPAGGTIVIEDNKYVNNLAYNSDSYIVNYRYTPDNVTSDKWTKNYLGDFDGASPIPNPNDAIIWSDLNGSNQSLSPASAIANLTGPEEAEFDVIIQPDPKFTDYNNEDYTLASDSALVNAGAELTNVTTADIGSGTALVVDNSYYFQDGKGINGVEADWIAVGSVSNTVQISSINYTRHTITLASDITRRDGDKVWLYKKSDGEVVLHGSAPDIGAYEYMADIGSVSPSPPSPPTNLRVVE